jgi:hypothetical protein
MKQIWIRKPWMGGIGLLCLTVVGLSTLALSNDPLLRWKFRTQPPIPVGATSLQASYPSNEVQRIIQFEIDPGAVYRVQSFYRTELPKENWRYRCTVDKPLNTSMEFMDVYERHTPQNSEGQMLEIGLRKQYLQEREISGQKRVVWVNEWLTTPPPYKGC